MKQINSFQWWHSRFNSLYTLTGGFNTDWMTADDGKRPFGFNDFDMVCLDYVSPHFLKQTEALSVNLQRTKDGPTIRRFLSGLHLWAGLVQDAKERAAIEMAQENDLLRGCIAGEDLRDEFLTMYMRREIENTTTADELHEVWKRYPNQAPNQKELFTARRAKIETNGIATR